MSDHDLEAYFARIGYNGPPDATRATLQAIHAHHARAIPYENLDVLLGRPIRLDPAALEQKLVRDRRGGYCFEQNGLLRDALRALGFRVAPLAARVRWQAPPEVITPLTHMLLRVEVDGKAYLADVGFGSISLVTPLQFDTEAEQINALEPRRLVRRGPLFTHQARLGHDWADVYQFSLAEPPPIDFELSNWWTSTHPQSRFVQNLMVARPDKDRRFALLNREFTVRYRDGRVERRTLDTPDELLAVLAQHFGLRFPPGTRFGQPGSPWPA